MNISARNQRGFSMIEVLIAVLVLAIGLLGVAALQSTSINSGQEGYFRSQATAIAEDLASRVKANADAKEYTGEYLRNVLGAASATPLADYLQRYVANPYLCPSPDFPAPQTPPANVWCRPDSTTASAGVSCTAAQILAFDRWEVCRSAVNLLPGGQIATVRNGTRLSIGVAWQYTALSNNSGAQADIRNPRCATVFGFANNFDCVIVEAIP